MCYLCYFVTNPYYRIDTVIRMSNDIPTTPQEIIDMMKLKKPTKPHKVMTLLQEDELRKYYQHIMYVL